MNKTNSTYLLSNCNRQNIFCIKKCRESSQIEMSFKIIYNILCVDECENILLQIFMYSLIIH